MNGGYLPGVRGAPTFPNLYNEGKAGGGYDVKIPKKGAPLYLQFKIPQIVTRSSGKCPPGIIPPYYRMHLMRRKYSLQHQSLLTHARRGRLVYYSSPTFHTTDDLNTFYGDREVPLNSVFISPDVIGALTDEPHHVAYPKTGKEAWLCSAPVQLDGHIDFEHFRSNLHQSLSVERRQDTNAQFFKALAEEITQTLRSTVLQAERQARERPPQQRDEFSPAWQVGYEEAPEVRAERIENRSRQQFQLLLDRFPLPAAVGYMARFYLDCELIIVGSD
jgi:hypothetical protein